MIVPVITLGNPEWVDGETRPHLEYDQSTYIPVGDKSCLGNPGSDDMMIIEVQTGSYSSEDDIVRDDDKYGR